MKPAMGTHEWTEKYAGKLSFREKLQMFALILRLQVQDT